MTSYDKIYKRFLGKIEDVSLAQMSKENRQEMLLEYLQSALGFIELDDLKIISDLSKRDDDLLEFEDDLQNNEIEGVALYMVVAWYEPMVNSLEHTNMFYGSKDEKWTNQKDHLKATSEIQEKYRSQARRYFKNYASRHNSYLEEEEES